jgi:hypothetical protein
MQKEMKLCTGELQSNFHEPGIPMKPIVILTLIAVLFFTTLSPACTAPPAADSSPQRVLKK